MRIEIPVVVAEEYRLDVLARAADGELDGYSIVSINNYNPAESLASVPLALDVGSPTLLAGLCGELDCRAGPGADGRLLFIGGIREVDVSPEFNHPRGGRLVVKMADDAHGDTTWSISCHDALLSD